MVNNLRWIKWGGVFLLVGLLSACLSTQRGAEYPRPPVWRKKDFKRHLKTFSEDMDERATGSEAFRRDAKYAAKRLHAYEVQPGLKSKFLVPYAAPQDSLYSLRVTRPPDTSAFVTGVDVLRHARTDTGRVETDVVSIVPREVVPTTTGRIAVLPENAVATPQQLRRAGASAVLYIGKLSPQAHRKPIPGLVTGQITFSAAQRLLSLTRGRLHHRMRQDTVNSRTLAGPLRIAVDATSRTEVKGVNVLGYISGRHPEHLDDAIIVCTDLDALSRVEGVPVRDFSTFGVATAAMLEAVRNVALAAPVARSMKRSLIVAIWSGSKQGHQGLRAYLNSPLWSSVRIRGVYYVGLAQEDEPQVRALLQQHDLSLHVIRHSGHSLFSPMRYLMPSDARSERAVEKPSHPDPNIGAVIERGAEVAQQLSKSTLQVLLGALNTPQPFAPADADTLRLPRDVGTLPE